MSASGDLNAKVQAAIREGDAKACEDLLSARSEEERAALSSSVLKTFDLAHSLVFSRDPSKAAKKLGLEEQDESFPRHDRNVVLEAARVALIWTLTNADAAKKYDWRSLPSDDEVAIRALAARPRAFVRAWITQLCEYLPRRWPLARRAVKEGLCDRPEADSYVLGMVHSGHFRQSSWQKDERPIFEEDPELLEDEIWRVFEVEGNREVSLTMTEVFWKKTLLELVATGRLDRNRMLDATLGALARDFAQHKAGFYSRLHDALEPTPNERAARVGAYLELLGSRIGPTVSLATRAVESLPDDIEIDTSSFAQAAVSAARAARGQSTALVLLRLLERRKSEPEALDAVAVFLEHPSVEVVDAAIAILETSGPSATLLERVAAVGPTIAASRRARLTNWLRAHHTAAVVASEASAAAVEPQAREEMDWSPSDAERAGLAALERAPAGGPWPRVTLDDRANLAPRLDPSRVVVPIADVTDLLAEAARALEDPKDALAFERVLDGVSRLGAPLSGLPLDASKPLARRAAKVAERISHPIGNLVRGWLAGDLGPRRDPTSDQYVNTMRFTERRVRNVLARVRKNVTRPLLSMPSTETFFVDPRAFAQRVSFLAKAEDIDIADAVTALLRLAPEHRAAAAEVLATVEGPLASAARHALGEVGEKPDAKHPALWVAAERARNGESAGIRFHWKKTTSSAAKDSSWGTLELAFTPAPPKRLDADGYPVLLAMEGHAGNGAQFGGEEHVRAMASIYPSDRRTLLAHGVERIAGNVSWASAAWENHVFIELLLDPDVPLDDVALRLLAIALNTKEARENALATDVLIAAIADGRVVGPELGAAMATFWDPLHDEVKWSQRATSARWAKTLGAVAETSALHAEVVRRTIESLFGAPPGATSPDAHALLQVWLDLAVDAGVSVPDPTVLAPYGSGKAKKIAAQLVALEGTKKSAHADEAHALAVEGRRTRARRHTRWRAGSTRGA